MRLMPRPRDRPTGFMIHRLGSAAGAGAGEAEAAAATASTLRSRRESASRPAAPPAAVAAERPRPKCSANARYSFGRTKVGGCEEARQSTEICERSAPVSPRSDAPHLQAERDSHARSKARIAAQVLFQQILARELVHAQKVVYLRGRRMSRARRIPPATTPASPFATSEEGCD